MDAEVIKSYLVKLGWQSDDAQFAKVNATLNQFSNEVKKVVPGVAKTFVEMGGTVVGVYASIATATVALLDNVANAEMKNQLFAMSMYMNVDAAKRLKMATDALGNSLAQITWNPELRKQFHELTEIQKTTFLKVLPLIFSKHLAAAAIYLVNLKNSINIFRPIYRR